MRVRVVTALLLVGVLGCWAAATTDLDTLETKLDGIGLQINLMGGGLFDVRYVPVSYAHLTLPTKA